MKRIFNILKNVISVIALLVLASGLVLTVIGGYEMVMAFTHVGNEGHKAAGHIAIGLLRAIDMFLIAIVFFVFSIGVLALFHDPETPLPVKLPEWLRIKNFVQLKVILWEAILTTLVVSYLAGTAEDKLKGIQTNIQGLIIPGVILLIALSLYFLKKGEHK